MAVQEDLTGLLETARRILGGAEPGLPSMNDDRVISFAHGDGLRPPPTPVLHAAVEQFLSQELSSRVDVYQFQVARPTLHDAILRDQRLTYGTSFSDVVFGHGITGLFNALGQTVRDEIDSLVCSPGYYHAWVSWARVLGLRFVPLSAGSDCLPDPDELDHVLRSRRSLLLVANPSYCGQLIGTDLARAVLQVCRKRRCVIVEDAIFARELHAPVEYRSICAYAQPDDLCVLMDSGSKSLGIANARVGWALGPPDLVQRLRRTLDVTGPSFFVFSLLLLECMLCDGAEWMARNRKELARRLTMILDAVRGISRDADGFAWDVPFVCGGSHSLVLRLRHDCKKYIVPEPFALTRHFLDAASLALAPGMTHGLTSRDVRLNYASVGVAKVPWRDLAEDTAFELAMKLTADGMTRLATGTRSLQRALRVSS